MHIFATFLPVLAIACHFVGLVFSAALPMRGDGKVIDLGIETIEVIYLPEGFDMSHPALNTSRLIEMRKEDPDATLPRLPEDLPIVKVQAETKLFCETSGASPASAHVLLNSFYLHQLGDTFCCQKEFKCTKMAQIMGAGTDICAKKGVCLRCKLAGDYNLLIHNKCVKIINQKSLAGGYVRYVRPF
jgi:hypothetical protein